MARTLTARAPKPDPIYGLIAKHWAAYQAEDAVRAQDVLETKLKAKQKPTDPELKEQFVEAYKYLQGQWGYVPDFTDTETWKRRTDEWVKTRIATAKENWPHYVSKELFTAYRKMGEHILADAKRIARSIERRERESGKTAGEQRVHRASEAYDVATETLTTTKPTTLAGTYAVLDYFALICDLQGMGGDGEATHALVTTLAKSVAALNRVPPSRAVNGELCPDHHARLMTSVRRVVDKALARRAAVRKRGRAKRKAVAS